MPQQVPRKMRTGSYAASTVPLVQGKGSNQSAADLKMMQQTGANAGAALRKVAPVGKQSYEDFQRTRHTPQGQADKEAYEAANKLPRLTDADYQQRRFNEGTGQVRKMAQANPGSSVFSGAPLNAAYATQRDRAVRLGNYADTDGKAATTASVADRSAKLPTQSAYVAPGVASGTVEKDLGDSTPVKKKMVPGPAIAKYTDGTKKVKANRRMAQDEEASAAESLQKRDVEADLPTVDAPAIPEAQLDMASARKMAPVPRQMPVARDAGPKKPADYQEAAAVIRSTPALKAQYRAGIASGKAFSLNIGGKTFKYAATPQKKATAAPETTTNVQGGNIRKARMQEADEMSQVAVQKMSMRKPVANKPSGSALNTATSPQMLGEDAENAAIRKQVRKMAGRS